MSVGPVGGNSVSNLSLLNNGSVTADATTTPSSNPIMDGIVAILENISKSIFAGAPAGETGPFGKTIDLNIEGIKFSLPNPLYRLDSFLGPLGAKVTNIANILGKVGQFLTSGERDLSTPPVKPPPGKPGVGGTPGGKDTVNVPGLNLRLDQIGAADGGIMSLLGGMLGTGTDASTTDASATDGTAPNAVDKIGGTGGTPGGVTDIGNLPGFGGTNAGGSTAFPASAAGDMYGGIGSAGEVSMTPDESAAYAKMTPAEQAQYMLQKKMEAHARMVALMTNMMKMMHDTLMGVIQNIKS